MKNNKIWIAAIFFALVVSYSLISKKDKNQTALQGEMSFSSEEEIKPLDFSSYDPQKPTVCNITINSDDEREAFQKHLGDEFNFIELVNESDPEWFANACKSDVQCDILVISGHFGGSFFGESNATLSTTELEEFACNSSCDNILKKPKEVFLFGCNTMAGKKPDSRTQDQYTQVLIDDGLSRSQAELVSAFRYSPIGSKNQHRMQRVFSQSRIYGFYSQAPLGHKIVNRLDNYFNSITSNNYQSHLSSVMDTEENKLWTRAMKGQYIRSRNGSDLIENPVCILQSDMPDYKKLDWVSKSLEDEDKILTYIPNIERYVGRLETRFGSNLEEWPKDEASYIERIQFNEKAKNKLVSIIERPQLGILSVQYSILSFTKRVGWLNENEYQAYRQKLIGDMFNENLDIEQKDLICSINQNMNLELSDLPTAPWNENTITALSCVGAYSKEIQEKVEERLNSNEYLVKLAVSYYFKKSPNIDEGVLERLQSRLHNVKDPEDTGLILKGLSNLINTNPLVMDIFIQELSSEKIDKSNEAVSSLRDVTTLSEGFLRKVFSRLEGEKSIAGLVRLIANKYSNFSSETQEEVQKKLVGAFDNELTKESLKALFNSAWVLNIKDQKIYDAVIENFNDKEFSVVLRQVLMRIYSGTPPKGFNEKLAQRIDEFDGDSMGYNDLFDLLIWVKSQDRSLIMSIYNAYNRAIQKGSGFHVKGQFAMIMQQVSITDPLELEFYKDNAPEAHKYMTWGK